MSAYPREDGLESIVIYPSFPLSSPPPSINSPSPPPPAQAAAATSTLCASPSASPELTFLPVLAMVASTLS